MSARTALAALAAAALASFALAAAAQDLAAGKGVYEGGCVACHGTGVLGAPKVGDAAAWKPRAAQGLATLLASARAGKGAMPARGAMPGLTDGQLQNAIAYMVSQSAGVPAAPARPAAALAAAKAPALAAAPAAKAAAAAPAAASTAGAAKPMAAAAVAPVPAVVAAPAAPVLTAPRAPAAPPAAAATMTAALQPAGAQAGVNTFNRLLRPQLRNRPPAEDGIHDPGNDATLALQPPTLAFNELTRSNAGNRVDWVKSLHDGKINPRADRLDPKAVPAVMDLNIVREVKGSMPDVVYPHKQHTEWLDCSNCHPAIFKPQKGANQISMASILLGQQCGVCHGKVAFPVSECRLCHSRPKATATAAVVSTPPAESAAGQTQAAPR
ncbi:c(7)-type cytochrome triheme domain-containing protein [Ramlibacter sp.]|uniref:c(7)-type cytochrome triheme domain-containing protein n=1 Tax=Ramlibacter sp. TaxID=1917967 RepID=UPI002605BB46|nr:c(7)-type cytochrome triheme domain-containing protein [Ramlibacter sp.]MDB5953702.1 Cytochrome c5 [Ramlibacter sp.]